MLSVELVPKTAWEINIRSEVSKSEWDRLRKYVYKKADYCCEVCGGKGANHPVEAHEIWEYDDKKHIQTLIGLIALCTRCHRVKHIGLAQVQGKYDQARKHLALINGWTIEEAEKYIRKQFDLWEKRSKFTWTIDYSWIENNIPNS